MGAIEGTKNTSITLIELVNEELDCNMEFLQIVTLSKKRKIFVINLENFFILTALGFYCFYIIYVIEHKK